MPDWVAWFVLLTTGGTLCLLVPFALHRTSLLLLARGGSREDGTWTGPLPRVTVQLPIYNEVEVVERLVDAAASLDYPGELLEIQLLDDSNDRTVEIGGARVAYWRERGVNIRHMRRPERDGYKAGALALGLKQARGEFILVLDADFVPPGDLIHRLLGPFRDPAVGMVQARWDHLNEEESQLTRCQALLLDGHFFFEQGGRYASGRFMTFNGTAGLWRRRALDEAGGWSADTLTEDLDVSYRAQMAGWRFVFRPEVGVPAELPETVRALEVQQKRWAQGGIQTARKILPKLMRGPWKPAVKAEAAVHLLGHLAHPLTILLGLLLLPSALARRALGLHDLLALDLLVFAVATGSFFLYFCAAGRKRDRPWKTLIPTAAFTLALGIGLGATVSGAVLRGARLTVRDPFERTPKRGSGRSKYRGSGTKSHPAAKGALATWMVGSFIVALHQELYASLPFITLFGSGYIWLLVADLPGSALGVGPVELIEPASSVVPCRGRVTL